MHCLLGASDIDQEFREKIRPLLGKYCIDCHGKDEHDGEIRFDELDPDLVNGSDANVWNDVLDQINLGEMPPEDAPQPSLSERRALSEWLADALRVAAEAQRYRDGQVTSRRLTNYEYANTLRDLLHVDLDFARDLPPDPKSPEGFLNNGAVLEMSPRQIEMYLQIARRALSEAIVTGTQPEVFKYSQQETAVGKFPNRKVAGHQPVNPEYVLDIHKFPRQGQFELKVTARASIPQSHGLPQIAISIGHIPGIIHVPRATVGKVDVSSQEQTYVFRGRIEDFPQPGPIAFGNSGFKGLIAMIDFIDADGQELRYKDRAYAQNQPPPKKKKNTKKNENSAKETDAPLEKQAVPFGTRLDIEVTSAEFVAPVFTSWPPASHKQILFEPDAGDDESIYVKQVLAKFMQKAYRRPVSHNEVDSILELYSVLRQRSVSQEEAIRETLASVLVSPHFLYLVEERKSKTLAPQQLSNFELASRLSYFLWSTCPDEQLFDLAERGTLNHPEVLQGQVERLLEDPRSSEFVSHFVDQWLDLDALNRVAVNPEYFPEFDNQIKHEMRLQTHEFFAEVLEKDYSALQLIDSEWEMLNYSLAKHYGIEGPLSSQFQRVDLDENSMRGGILTHGSFLLANSNGEDSHPIKRAVWVLDRILDSPPAPPPPDVPELDTSRPDLAQLSIKQQLEVHRQKESCNACHQGIDPWGIPFENFDAVGRWRRTIPAQGKRSATQVDSVSHLPGGQQIRDIEDLRGYLKSEKKQLFARSLVKQLLSYGLGRSLDYGDRETIEVLTNRFIKNDFRLQALIVDFVQSQAFQTK